MGILHETIALFRARNPMKVESLSMTDMEKYFAQALDVVSSAKKYVLLVSPRVQIAVLEKILNMIPDSVRNVDCITRWNPNKMRNRLCDPEVFDLIATRKGARLWSRNDLHAKFIRGDDRCLVGSVNLTKRSLGLQSPRNFELRIEVASHFPGLEEWESTLLSGSRLVISGPSDERIMETGTVLTRQPIRPYMEIDRTSNRKESWIPLCPQPEKLFGVYAGSIGENEMEISAYEQARSDLRTLDPPAGCAAESDFISEISSRLMGFDFFDYICFLSRSGISDYQAAEIMVGFLDISHEISPEDAWKTIKLWLTYFFPDEFRIETRQDIMVRNSSISA